MVIAFMEKKKHFLTLIKEWGFDYSWGSRLLKKYPDILKKGYVKAYRKGKRTFYFVEDEEGLIKYLRSQGYWVPPGEIPPEELDND
jgi:hypothetical protein